MQVIKLNVIEAGSVLPTVFNVSRISDVREVLGATRVAFLYKSTPRDVSYVFSGSLEDIPLEPCYVPGARVTLPCMVGGVSKQLQLQVDDMLFIRSLATAPAQSLLICIGKRAQVVTYVVFMALDDIVTLINEIQCGSGSGGGIGSMLIEGYDLNVGNNAVPHLPVSAKVAAVSVSVDGGEWQPWPFDYTDVPSELTHVNLPSTDSIKVDIYLIF